MILDEIACPVFFHFKNRKSGFINRADWYLMPSYGTIKRTYGICSDFSHFYFDFQIRGGKWVPSTGIVNARDYYAFITPACDGGEDQYRLHMANI